MTYLCIENGILKRQTVTVAVTVDGRVTNCRGGKLIDQHQNQIVVVTYDWSI